MQCLFVVNCFYDIPMEMLFYQSKSIFLTKSFAWVMISPVHYLYQPDKIFGSFRFDFSFNSNAIVNSLPILKFAFFFFP